MLYKSNIPVTIEINTVQDLSKLGAFMEHNDIKVNKSEIARKLNINRRTVDKYLKGFQKCKHRNKPSRLDEYTDIIGELLSSDVQVFAYRSILYRYLCDNHSLDIPAPTFYHYLKQHPEFDQYFRKNKPSNCTNNPVIRFETNPGHQAQIDWKESIDFVIRDTGEIVTINVLVMVFSFSRFRLFCLALNKSREVLIHLLSECFDIIGGVPKEIVTDNMKSVMDSARTHYSSGKVNKTFEAFAKDYGFSVKPCVAATPQTKGKVETQMKFLDEIKAYSGSLNLTELAALIERINVRINSSIHQGTGKIPMIEFQKERTHLQSLPSKNICNQYKIASKTAKVNTAGMISVKSKHYSVPKEYIGLYVSYWIIEGNIYICHEHRLIAVHIQSDRKLNYHEEHYVDVLNSRFNGMDKDSVLSMAKENLNVIGGIFNCE